MVEGPPKFEYTSATTENNKLQETKIYTSVGHWNLEDVRFCWITTRFGRLKMSFHNSIAPTDGN